MELRRELVLTIGMLILLNLVLALGSVGLLARMGPAIARILDENVYSIVAAEEILATVASNGGRASSPEKRLEVMDALDRASRNVTEEEERPVLDRLAGELEAALEGDESARQAAVADVRELIRVNRAAMNRVDAEARRLGSAGAWAGVLLGFLSFTLSLLGIALLNRRVLRPLEELHSVLEAVRRGDPLRRCHPGDTPVEVRQVATGVNNLLDERLLFSEPSEREALERSTVKELMERHPRGVAVVNAEGTIVHASRRMLAALAGANGGTLRAAMTSGGDPPPDLEIVFLGEDAGRLCLLGDAARDAG